MQWQVNAIQWHAVASDCDTYLPDALPRLADCVPHMHPAQLALEDGVTPHLRVQGVQLLAGQRQLPLPFTVPDRERDTHGVLGGMRGYTKIAYIKQVTIHHRPTSAVPKPQRGVPGPGIKTGLGSNGQVRSKSRYRG